MKSPTNLQLGVAWAAMAAALSAVAIWPRWRAISQLEQRSVALSQMIAEADDVNAQIRELTEWMLEIESRVRASTTPIPRDSGVADLVRELTDKFRELGVAEREITTGAASNGDEASALPMTVVARGSFTSVVESIRWIESLPRLVRIRRIKIERARDWSMDNPKVSAEFLLDAFFDPRPIPDDVDLASLIERQGDE
ncbi:MAG: type 4a pilus biogenesis protein PilO [Phycisphaerales bacterium]